MAEDQRNHTFFPPTTIHHKQSKEITVFCSADSNNVALLTNHVLKERLHKDLVQRVLLQTDDRMARHRSSDDRVLHEGAVVLRVLERLVVVGQHSVADAVAVDVVGWDSSQLPADEHHRRVEWLRLVDDPH